MIRLTPREARAIDALMPGQWVEREALDLRAGSSNAPDIVFNLRSKLGEDGIETQLVHGFNRDGDPVRYGRYRLTPAGRERLRGMASNDDQGGK